jgi:N-acetylmuramoyl-L-alanine amidase
MPNQLLLDLAKAYAGATIEFPQLRAVSLAQWLIESGRATSDLAKLHNNFAGLKWRPEMAPHATKVSYTAHDGTDFYCAFASLDKFIAGYWAFLERSPYKGWKTHAATGEDFIRFVGPIYCPPNAGYAADVIRLIPEAKGLLGSAGSGEPAPAPSPPSPAAMKKLKPIVLDPGHGGTAKLDGSSANNAISVSGALEKNLALEFCKILKAEIQTRAAAAGEQVDVFMTRTTDVNVGIKNRAKVASDKGAKLFLSVHFNGSDNADVSGVETFFATAGNGNMNEAQDKAFAGKMHAALLAGLKAVNPATKDRKLKPDTVSGPGRLGTLNDLSLGNAGKADKCLAAYYEVEFISNPGRQAADLRPQRGGQPDQGARARRRGDARSAAVLKR